jgi:anti-sigma B factor antagonist
MALSITESESGGIRVLKLSGRVIMGAESSQLHNKIKEVLAKGTTRLVLDLADVDYIGSAGLGTLAAGFASAQNQGASIKLANLTRKFYTLLHITRLGTVFEAYDTVEDAIKSFDRAAS